MTTDYSDDSPSYWQDYSNLQRVKHMLIREYLNGWFPKLGTWAKRVIYFDTHAGRGKHLSGDLGSPLVALTTFLQHSYREQILSRSEVCFFFVERDEENRRALQQEIDALGSLPTNVWVQTAAGNCFELLRGLVEDLRARGESMAPAFFFIDPYGFKVPGSVLRDLMQLGRVELFENVIWRELDMAVSHGRKDPTGTHATNLTEIFGSREWLKRLEIADFDRRAEEAANLLQELTGAAWATHFAMQGDNKKTRYLLLHLSNHDAGRDLMKDCMWKVCPDGGFYARKGDHAQQSFLIAPEPDLGPLREWVLTQLEGNRLRWSELEERVRRELWRKPHLNEVVRGLRKAGAIQATDFKGKFSRAADPLLHL